MHGYSCWNQWGLLAERRNCPWKQAHRCSSGPTSNWPSSHSPGRRSCRMINLRKLIGRQYTMPFAPSQNHSKYGHRNMFWKMPALYVSFPTRTTVTQMPKLQGLWGEVPTPTHCEVPRGRLHSAIQASGSWAYTVDGGTWLASGPYGTDICIH